jgi:hypothetical protein
MVSIRRKEQLKMLKKMFQCGAALIVGIFVSSTTLAGQVSSQSITQDFGDLSDEQVCDDAWSDAKKRAFQWYREGKIDFFSTSVRSSSEHAGTDGVIGEDDWTYLIRWESLTGVDLAENLVLNAEYAMMFTVEKDSSLDNTDPGAYIFFYNASGCYIGAAFAPGFSANGESSKDGESILELM